MNGCDVDGSEGPGEADCCRLYADGAPSREQISHALKAAHSNGNSGDWRQLLPALPGIGIAFMPKLACPLCWPAYAGILSSLGLGFLADTAYLLPFTVIFLALALGALAFRARQRRGYAPFAAGAVAAGLLVLGKFLFESEPVFYLGISLLVVAAIWNAWPSRATPGEPSCPACLPDETFAGNTPVNEREKA
ncbi:MAG: MerC family mercury resistance protein [Verrucomicrobia bacterium]|nr:MerC family mercury resistance protein [Verrucomicrobiota bacterium]